MSWSAKTIAKRYSKTERELEQGLCEIALRIVQAEPRYYSFGYISRNNLAYYIKQWRKYGYNHRCRVTHPIKPKQSDIKHILWILKQLHRLPLWRKRGEEIGKEAMQVLG